MTEIHIPQLAHEFLEISLFTEGWALTWEAKRYRRWRHSASGYVVIVPTDHLAEDYEDLIQEAEAARQRVRSAVRKPKLMSTADIEALPPETVFRTANGSVGRIFDTGILHIVQWCGTDLFDELPRDNFYPFPDIMFPAEVIWSPEQ